VIKLIVFDLDGVLVSTKELHYVSLNRSLSDIDSKYEINLNEHYELYDGLPTMRKLKMLTQYKNLPLEYYEQINRNKQKYTFDLIRETIKKDERLIEIFKKLKSENYKIYVASNSIRETTKLLLYYTGLIEYVDYYISNEDVKNSKPSSEMYLKCMIHAEVNPDETLIVEDSPRGIEAALNSKAKLLIVENPDSVTYEKINNYMNQEDKPTTLKLSNFNILIPMAGEGSRFKEAGFTFPKPLIEVNGKPMIQVIIENLGFEANYIYVVRKEHYDKYNLKSFLNLITPNCKIIQVESLTEGAACTTLLAKEYINNDNPLIIANSDQFLEWNPIDFYYKMIETKADGGIVTFKATHPKWSFAKINELGNVIQVAEKDPISDMATVGIYYYKKGSEYVKYAEQMISKNIRTNNEFYVCPIFNEYIGDNKKIKTYGIEKMFGIGTPEDLQYFLNNYNQ
jgi:HAD superfamily hydrolase (TIGR01509 family)